MTKTPRIRRYALLGASLCVLASQMPAIAQDGEAAPAEAPADSSLKLGSIVVTAQRREESINDVPMSIQAFGEDTLDALRVDSVDDLQNVVPSFSVSQSYQGVPTYTLRGIGFNTINVSATSTVGTYVDEVAYPYPFMNSGPVFDIQRVEVLKGPQGTLFGRNTTAGLINMVTNKPSDEFEGSVTADVGNYDTWNLEGILNVPISDRAQARFGIRSENSDEGWQKSITSGQDRGTKDKLGFRAALALQPTDNLDVDISYNGWRSKSDTTGGQAIALTPNTDPTFIVPGTNGPSTTSLFNAVDPITGLSLVDFVNNNFPTSAEQTDWAPNYARTTAGIGVNGIDGPLEEDTKFDALKLSVRYGFDNGLNLVSLTGYNKLDREAVLDFSSAPFAILVQDVDAEIKSFSQELRLEGETGKANWLVGAYYGKDETTDTNRTLLLDNANSSYVSTIAATLAASPLNVDPETGAPYSVLELLNSFQTYRDTGEFETTTWSIFANADWELTPEFSLTTGIRYTEDSQDYVGCSADVNGSMQPNVNVFNRTYFALIYQTAPAAPLLENGCNTFDVATNSFGSVSSETKEDNVSWRVVGNWTPTDNLVLFASATQGYKSASTPVNAASKSEQNAPATQEGLLAYEVGFKASLLDQRMQANAALFYYDYEDKQLSAFFADPIYKALARLQNVPTAEAYGLDAEVTYLISEELTAIGGLTLLHTEIGDFDTVDSFGLPTNRQGDPFLYSPESVASLALLYDRPVTTELGLRASVSGRWQSESTAGQPNDPLYDIDSYGLLNGSIGIYSLNNNWDLSVWGKNLTDEYYWQQITTNANVVVRYAGMPRTFGASLTYRF
ncbi:MAG: TonB-dependent receptor [Hyphomonas sp.]|uniref:TonB-dependent receptor n=1 Tax=Hyphomonas sp. TaxID=87 RepID=UPI0030031D1C